jgi:hypothetical protein
MSREAYRAAIAAAVAEAGGVWLAITREDGTEGTVAAEINADSTGRCLVPEGVTMAGGSAVTPGDTVSGKIDISPW